MVKTNQRDTGVGFFTKYVVVLFFECIQHMLRAINVNVIFLQIIEWPNIIKASRMVPVFMGEKQGIYPADASP